MTPQCLRKNMEDGLPTGGAVPRLEGQLRSAAPASDRCMRTCAAARSPVGSELMRREVPAATRIKKERKKERKGGWVVVGGGGPQGAATVNGAVETQGRLLRCLTH